VAKDVELAAVRSSRAVRMGSRARSLSASSRSAYPLKWTIRPSRHLNTVAIDIATSTRGRPRRASQSERHSPGAAGACTGNQTATLVASAVREVAVGSRLCRWRPIPERGPATNKGHEVASPRVSARLRSR
jgi:hypothetical protein